MRAFAFALLALVWVTPARAADRDPFWGYIGEALKRTPDSLQPPYAPSTAREYYWAQHVVFACLPYFHEDQWYLWGTGAPELQPSATGSACQQTLAAWSTQPLVVVHVIYFSDELFLAYDHGAIRRIESTAKAAP